MEENKLLAELYNTSSFLSEICKDSKYEDLADLIFECCKSYEDYSDSYGLYNRLGCSMISLVYYIQYLAIVLRKSKNIYEFKYIDAIAQKIINKYDNRQFEEESSNHEIKMYQLSGCLTYNNREDFMQEYNIDKKQFLDCLYNKKFIEIDNRKYIIIQE